jgi:hypothetical protein
MNRVCDVVAVAVPFVWFGMVLAISGLETPLKFRAPGITRALGLGIGRLVFRALNMAELVLLVMLSVALAGSSAGRTAVALDAFLWLALLVQVLGLRPLLDRRARLILDGVTPPPSSLHHAYIGLEAVKLFALPTLGVVLTLSMPH